MIARSQATEGNCPLGYGMHRPDRECSYCVPAEIERRYQPALSRHRIDREALRQAEPVRPDGTLPYYPPSAQQQAQAPEPEVEDDDDEQCPHTQQRCRYCAGDLNVDDECDHDYSCECEDCGDEHERDRCRTCELDRECDHSMRCIECGERL